MSTTALQRNGDQLNGLDGPHREMAIDVPSNFVPQKKEKPRLSGSWGKEAEKAEKLKKYQKAVKDKNETNLKLQREQDFLRASLRESKKLQNLESRRQRTAETEGATNDGFINNAFDDEQAATAKTKGVEHPRVDVDAASMQRILGLLQALRAKLGDNSNELRVMNNLFNNVQFQDAVSLYKTVTNAQSSGAAATPSSHNLSADLYAAIQKSETSQAKQLQEILSKPPFKDVLLPSDLATSQPSAEANVAISSTDKAGEYGEPTVKIVTIVKTADPLGATVRNDGESVVIGRIVKGGVADKTGLLHEGDEILEVNDTPMRGKMINEVSDMLAGMTGPIQFVVVPSSSNTEPREVMSKPVSVRALFDYDPEDDTFIPCQELGVGFQTGDILHVINQDDPYWWQAYREGEEDQALAGLVPSKTFWETREQLRLTILAETAEAEQQGGCCPSSRKKRKKSQYNADDIDPEDILTYEEVTKYYPQPNRNRPIVLIGPPDVGRKELRESLLASDSDRFAAAIPHTSRPRREDEIDGNDYYFTARHVFEADIRANKFVEHGQYQKDYYGTSLDAIKSVVVSGKICVLNLHPQALKILRSSDVKPYIVFIAPPNLDRLRHNIQASGREVSVDYCKNIIDKGREIENKYGHFFDYIICNNDIDNAFNELLNEINRLEIEPQWIPSEWLK